MESLNADKPKQFLGLPRTLIWGYVAIAIFITGNEIEQAFISKCIVNIGFEAHQASTVLTLYWLSMSNRIIAFWYFSRNFQSRNYDISFHYLDCLSCWFL